MHLKHNPIDLPANKICGTKAVKKPLRTRDFFKKGREDFKVKKLFSVSMVLSPPQIILL